MMMLPKPSRLLTLGVAGAAIAGEWSSITAGPAAVGMDPCSASAALGPCDGPCGYGGYGSNPCHKKG